MTTTETVRQPDKPTPALKLSPKRKVCAVVIALWLFVRRLLSRNKTAYLQIRPSRTVDGWICWGGLWPLVADNVIDEPGEPIYFATAETRERAIAKVKSEMSRGHRITKWVLPNSKDEPHGANFH